MAVFRRIYTDIHAITLLKVLVMGSVQNLLLCGLACVAALKPSIGPAELPILQVEE